MNETIFRFELTEWEVAHLEWGNDRYVAILWDYCNNEGGRHLWEIIKHPDNTVTFVYYLPLEQAIGVTDSLKYRAMDFLDREILSKVLILEGQILKCI